MLFTWSTENLCIVFEGWRITGTASLIFSLFAIILMTAGYEAVREASRKYDAYAKVVSEGRRGSGDFASKCFPFCISSIYTESGKRTEEKAEVAGFVSLSV
jgi:hypothetical protein